MVFEKLEVPDVEIAFIEEEREPILAVAVMDGGIVTSRIQDVKGGCSPKVEPLTMSHGEVPFYSSTFQDRRLDGSAPQQTGSPRTAPQLVPHGGK